MFTPIKHLVKAYFNMVERVWCVAAHGFYRHSGTPVMWFVFAASLFALQALTFFVGDLLGKNDASMAIFFTYLPFILVVFAPLLVAGSWAAEKQNNMADLLATQPINPLFYDIGVFKGYVLLFMVWLTGSLTLPITLNFLGDLNWQITLSGYLGAFLFGLVFIALCYWASSLVRSTLAAYGAGVLAGVFVLLTAAEGVMLLTPIPVPSSLQEALLTFSPMHVYDRMTQGFIIIADVIWLLALVVAFVLFEHHNRCKTIGVKVRYRNATAVIVLLFGVFFSFYDKSFDVGSKGQFKPSLAAFDVLEPLPSEGVRVDFYFSAENLAMPGALRAFGRQVSYYLKELEKASPKIHLRIIDPSTSPQLEQLAQNKGLEPHVLPDGGRVYLGVVIAAPTQEVVMPALLLPRRHLFEFDFMNNIARLQHDKTRRIAVLTGLNMGDDKQRPAFLEMLTPFYRVDVTNHANAMIPDQNDLVIVYSDALLSETSLYALDQYILRGGKALILVDPFWFTAPTGRLQTTPTVAPHKTLVDLINHWGFGYNPSYILADEALGSPVQVTQSAGIATHPLWLGLHSAEINQENPIGRGLSTLSLAATGALELAPPRGVMAHPLLVSSQKGALFPRRLIYQAEIGTLNHFYEGVQKQYAIAAVAEGLFPALFEKRPAIVADWFAEEGAKWPAEFIAPHKPQAEVAGEVIVVADLDLWHPQLAAIGDTLEPANDNFNLMFNMVRALLGEPEALRIHLRQKAGQRPLVTLERVLTQLSQTMSSSEIALINKLTTIRTELTGLKQKLSLSSVENPLIAEQIRAQELAELKIIHQLDAVRQKTARKARYFISLITGVNLFGGSFLFVLCAAGMHFFRRRGLTKRFAA